MAQKDFDFILSDVFPALRAAGLTSHIEAIKAVMRCVAAPPDEAFKPEPEPEPIRPPVDPVIGTPDPNPPPPQPVEPVVEQKRKK
jgi:hypothetical protein